MPIFNYRALDAKGKQRRGTIDADTARDARTKLRHNELRVTKMTKLEAGKKREGASPTRKSFWEKRVNLRELAIVTRQFSTLLSSGVHLSEALSGLPPTR